MSDRAPNHPASVTAEDLADLFDHAPCGYLTMSPDGRITKVNFTFAEWIGLSEDDLRGKRLRDLLTVAGRIFYETNFAPHLRLQGGFEEVALDLVTGGGEKLPVLVNASERRDGEGRLLAIRVVVMRAKDRRGYERDLLGREALAVQRLRDEQAASELREQFIAVLGHDLRNPLASIVGGARLLGREPLSEKAVQLLKLMEASVDRMAGLIDNVMDFARARLGGGIDLSRRVGSLEPILRHVVSELEINAPSRVIACRFDLRDAVSFDDSRMGQLVSNLLSNALTYGDPRQPVRLDVETRDGRLELSVANAGEPISEAAMDRLFQPFFRGDVRPNQQGLGLGLHIASEIANAHGGVLEVRSDAVETRFTLSMPLTEADAS
ncbi:MAG TPA: PAS domain-containing sensor histidine kinase [Caulobacteraceae bacterium]|nr:PAS domain-containing sensor histidine kinase [Caulobacteraceae bacterium]